MPSLALESAGFAVEHYDLAVTLGSGQAFRWRQNDNAWEGIIGARWVRLRQDGDRIHAEAAAPGDWQWLRHFLQLDVQLPEILATFPEDEPMRAAIAFCSGLRLLRQDPWECVASFICSSTKQIVQIQQIIALLSQRFGDLLPVPEGVGPAYCFPSIARIAEASEAELRECKLGFRAPYLSSTSRALAVGKLDLSRLGGLPLDEARAALLNLPGVGAKIADCVLLFAYGFPRAFPVDVWIARALRQLYFPNRRPKPPRLLRFIQTYFGPHSGYAQQYLFHYMRTKEPARPRRRRST
ncbi:MAG TPA: DNA glycosylase [Verrucomicrobiae bacterium]|jgi:N-glycosylase/DNA lyase|nr:DNA glycosylase [Verrucomicrobiae bacterium]